MSALCASGLSATELMVNDTSKEKRVKDKTNPKEVDAALSRFDSTTRYRTSQLIVTLEIENGLRKRYPLCHVTARPVITLPLLRDASSRRLQDVEAGITGGPHSDPAGLRIPFRIQIHKPSRYIVYSVRAVMINASWYAGS